MSSFRGLETLPHAYCRGENTGSEHRYV